MKGKRYQYSINAEMRTPAVHHIDMKNINMDNDHTE